MNRIYYIVVTSFIIGAFSCDREKTEPDLTQEVVGTYQGGILEYEPSGPPREPKQCQFTISKIDNNTVSFEFIAGINNPSLTADITKGEGNLKFTIVTTQTDSLLIEGRTNSSYPTYHGQYLIDKRQIEMNFMKTFDGKFLYVGFGGKH